MFFILNVYSVIKPSFCLYRQMMCDNSVSLFTQTGDVWQQCLLHLSSRPRPGNRHGLWTTWGPAQLTRQVQAVQKGEKVATVANGYYISHKKNLRL